MKTGSALVRQWQLLRMLSTRRHGLSIQEMAEEAAVHAKTIRRDLATFLAAGFPLEELIEPFGRKKWRLEPAKGQPGVCFTSDEAVALYLGRRFLEPLAGTFFWDAAQNAFKKIRASLGAEALVVEPEGLKEEIRDELRTLVELMESSDNRPSQQPRST